MFYLFAHQRFAQYILTHSPSHCLTHNPKMAQDLVQGGGVLAAGTMTMWAWPGCSLAQAGCSPSLPHTMSGLDWLIGSCERFPGGPVRFLGHKGRCSVIVLGWNISQMLSLGCLHWQPARGVQPGWWCNYALTPADGITLPCMRKSAVPAGGCRKGS